MIGLGCMRLSTERDRDDARSAEVITAAVEAGITLFDTADAYALDDHDAGHNERLLAPIARRATVVTKGGLVRPDGAWVPDGRARHLAEAARASRDRLGVDAIDLYLLHVVDPKTPLATSVRALAKLVDDGVIRAIGLSNVSGSQLAEAAAIAPISAVEIELSPWNMDAMRSGLVLACAERGIRVLAHRPLGGPKGVRRAKRELGELARDAGITPSELVLAWLQTLPEVVPIPGATRVDTVRSIARAGSLVLSEHARIGMQALFLAFAIKAPRRPTRGDVVVIMGMPGAGKSTLAQAYVERGFARLNRDERGGRLADLADALDELLTAGTERVLLDNTYGTRASRARIVEVAHRHDVRVRVIEMTTSLHDAQTNAALRMLSLRGRLLEPAEIARDPEVVGPGAQFRYRRSYEKPTDDEGFDAIEPHPFSRARTGRNVGLIVELDHLVWEGRPRSPEAIRLRDGIVETLARWPIVCGTTWQPGSDAHTIARLADRLVDLGLAIDVAGCTHAAGPPVCWCRKPMPGLGLVFARAHDLDLAASVCVGRGPADRGFAERLGARYVDVTSEPWPVPAA
jgi:aryl-alcohol dehydrogenase-like predicted oxidoreductase